MDILIILFWAAILSLIVSILIRTFPTVYSRTSVESGAQKIQNITIIIYAILSVVVFTLYKFYNLRVLSIEIRIAIMLIPVISVFLFSAFLYYPLTRFLVKRNIDDQDIMDKLLMCTFKCAYCDKSTSEKTLQELSKFLSDNDDFIKQYGLSAYYFEYIQQAQYAVNNKPSESIIRCVLDRCNQVKHDIDEFTPTPFPNIGLILSFVFSTVLTVLLSIITIVP